MNCIVSERSVWVIKDQDGNFARRDSISKQDKHTWLYISHKEFSEGCRAYTTKERAEEELLELNKKNKITGFNAIFYLEYVDLNMIVNNINRLMPSENLVIVEKNIASEFPLPVIANALIDAI